MQNSILKLHHAPSLTDYGWIDTLLSATRKLRYEYLFPLQLKLAIGTLNFFGDKQYCQNLFSTMGKLPHNTIGRVLHKMMKQNNIMLVPWYKEHDMKHAILGYQMNVLDEIRMQCFMWGNSPFNLFNSFMTLFFIIWTPEMWLDAIYHFRAGKLVNQLDVYKLNQCMRFDLTSFRKNIKLARAQEYFRELDFVFLRKKNGRTRSKAYISGSKSVTHSTST
mgnify:CR=1 FL=1